MNKISSQRDIRNSKRHDERDLDIDDIEETTNVRRSNNRFLRPNSLKNITQNIANTFLTENPYRKYSKSKATLNQIDVDPYYAQNIENNDMEILKMDITERVNKLTSLFKNRRTSNMNVKN